MGGQNSKPVRTIKVEPVHGYNSTGENEEKRDELQAVKDTLGIVAAEQDYPEALPPGNDLQPILEESEQGETLSMVNDSDTKSKVSDKTRTDALVSVQIGTSLQKSLSKRLSDSSHFQKIENEAGLGHSESLTTASLTSLHDSILVEQHLNLINKTLVKKRDQNFLTQRDALLIERESFIYRKLTEKPDPTLTSFRRGQIRLFDSVRELHYDCRDRKRPHRDGGAVTANEAAEMSDAVKVKAIIAWMCKQNIGRIDFGQKRFDPDTPNGYMQLMQESKGTYPGFFALLCRAANVKCAIISGISKGAGYEVGNLNTDGLQNAWNAVFIDNGWRLVHPLWVCKSLAGRRQGGWMTVESQGNFCNDVRDRSDGEVTNTYNDYFIFTKPAEFIYRHLPDDPKWQLLPVPISIDSFLDRSYCRPAFFINDFKILSDDQCELVSKKGEPIQIVIGYPDTVASELVFGYELDLKLPEDIEVKKSSADCHENFERFVFVSKAKDRVSFEIRFAKTGNYKLRLFGGLYSEYGNKPPWIMDVKLVCRELAPKLIPLPFDPGIVGWGPGPVADNLGLFVPSHESSTIELAFDDVIIIQFILKERMVFNITLRHVNIRPSVLEKNVSFEILDKMDILELRISLSCPNAGEYGLKIDVCNEGTQENACNYRVQTGKEKTRETYYQRKARKLLTEAMMTNDESLLTHALKACEESSLPVNDPEVNAGERRLEYLHCKEGLKTALMVNRIDKSEEALQRVQRANLNRLFEKEIIRVKHHLKQLLSLDKDGWNSRIPEIDRISLMELGQLRQPKQPVKYVVMAMYMLLGVPQDMMTDWGQIKALLRHKDTTLVEMARLENYLDMNSVEITFPDDTTMGLVEEVLQTYSEDDVRRIDNTAAAYYIWVRMTHSKLKQKLKSRLKSRQVSTGRASYDIGARSSIISVPDRSQSKSVTGVRRLHSYKPTVKQEEEADVFSSTSLKHETDANHFRNTSVKQQIDANDANVFRSTSVKHQKDVNVFRSVSERHEKDSNIFGGPSVKVLDISRTPALNYKKVSGVSRNRSVQHDKGPDDFRSTPVKHENNAGIFRRPSVNHAKVSDVLGSQSVAHETASDVFRSPSSNHENGSNAFWSPSIKHENGSNAFWSPSIKQEKSFNILKITSVKYEKDFGVLESLSDNSTHEIVTDAFKSPSLKVKADGRQHHVEANHGKGKPNNSGSQGASRRNVRIGGLDIQPRKIVPETDSVTSGKAGSPRPKRKTIPIQSQSGVKISRKQPVSAILHDENDNLTRNSSNITAYRHINDRHMSGVQKPRVEVDRRERPKWLDDSAIDKTYSIPKSNLNSGKNSIGFFRVATKESTAITSQTHTQPNHNGETLSFISNGNDSVNHLQGKSSIESENAMKVLEKRDRRKVANGSGIFNLQASDEMQRSGKIQKVSQVQQNIELQAVNQINNTKKASLKGANTITNGRLKTAMFREGKVPHTKPLSRSGNIRTIAKGELENSVAKSSCNGVCKDRTFVKNKMNHAL